MKTILILIAFLFVFSNCNCQKIDSAGIKNLMQGRWVDTNKGNTSVYYYESMDVSGDSIFFDFMLDQTIDIIAKPIGRHKYYYQITKIGCFQYGFSTKAEGTGYFFRVKYQRNFYRGVPYPFSEESDVCYYIKLIDTNQLVLEIDGGGREKVYRKAK